MSAAGMKLFGRPAFLVDGQECSLTPQHLALLGLLYGHEREGLGRAEVTTLLWAGGSDDSVRRRLSQLLYSLVSRCGESVLLRAGDTLARPPHMPSDLRDFSEHLEQGRYDEAAALVGLGFLDVLPVVPTTEYQDWLDRRRLSLRESLRKAAARQWSAAEAQGQWGPRSLAAAQALRLLDPRNETAVRNVMWAQALCSSPAEAIATYESFVETLGPGQGAADETRTLLQRIRSLARQKRGSAPTLRSPRSEPRMYGREAEVARLRPLLAEPRADHFETVAIVGEAGFGKTRLLQESLAAAALQGRLVLEARLAELEKDVALNALTEALSTREVAEALTRVEDPWRSVVLTFLPEAAQVAGAPIEVPEIQRSSLHRRLLESLRQLFDALAANHSIVVVLDDAHWIDDSSLAALEYIRRRWRTGSATLVLTYRPEHVQRGSKLHAFLAEAECQELALGPLDEASQKQLTAEFGGADLGAEAARWIQDLAKGNPLFLIELIRQCLSGDLVLPPSGPDEINLPSSIQQLFDRRLAGLTQDDRRTLEALAVWGRVASLTDLLALTGLDEEAAVASLERLDAAGLVRWGEEGTELWHELLRQSVLQGAVGVRRQLLHRRAGRLLLADASAPVGETALHLDKGGLRQEAFQAGLASASAAEESGTFAEAAVLLSLCIRNAPDRATAAQLLPRRAKLDALQWRWRDAAAGFRLAAERLSEVGESSQATLALLGQIDAEAKAGTRPPLEVSRAFWQALTLLESVEDWDGLAVGLDFALHHFEYTAEVPQTLERARRLLSYCLDRGSVEARCIAGRLQVLETFFGDLRVARDAVFAGIDLAETNHLGAERLKAYAAAVVVMMCTGELHRGLGGWITEGALTAARNSGDLTTRCGVLSNLGAYYTEVGEVDRAERYLTDCIRLLPADRYHPDALRVLSNFGEMEVERRAYHKAEEWYRRCLEIVPREHPGLAFSSLVGIGICAAGRGQMREARRMAEEATELLEVRPFSHEVSHFYRLGAEIALRDGRRGQAMEIIREGQEQFHGRRWPLWLRMQLWVCQIARRLRSASLEREAELGIAEAQRLELAKRESDFRSLLSRATAA